MSNNSGCAEKIGLFNSYEDETHDFSRSLTIIRARIREASKQEYEELIGRSERARLRSDRARTALEKHVAEHGC